MLTVGDTREARKERVELNSLSAGLSRVAAAGTLASDEIAQYLERPDSAHWEGAVQPRLRTLATDLDALQRDLGKLTGTFVGENPKTYADLMTGVGRRAGAIANLSLITPPAQPTSSELANIRTLRDKLMIAITQVEKANAELGRYIGARFVQKKGCPA